MKVIAPYAVAAVVAGLASGQPAAAHHSYAMFDSGRTDTLTGVVKSLEIVNPHGWLTLMVAGSQGRSTEWSLEMGGPGQAQRQGWTSQTVKAGDTVTVRLHPLLDNSHGGQLLSATLEDGRVLQAGPPIIGRGGPGQ